MVELSYVVKFPEKSMAPPTYCRDGKLMAWRLVLLAIWLAPPMVFKRGMEMLVNLTLFTKARLPTLLDIDPTAVRLGA